MSASRKDVLKDAGRSVRGLRNRQGLSQEALAEKAEVHDRTIGKIERGELNFSILILLRLSEALCCSPNDILEQHMKARKKSR